MIGLLLKDYWLLNLGRLTLQEARRWQMEMAARRRFNASRDLLAFWQPQTQDGLSNVGQLVAFAIFHPYRLSGELTLEELRIGLTEAVRQTLADFGLQGGIGGNQVWVNDRTMARVECMRDDGVLLGEVYIEALLISEFLMKGIPSGQLSNGVAFHIEEIFGYAASALHPVAYEEQMRPQDKLL
ncbi:MAG: hypothetical protein ACOY93_14390 [Bacillota bacterium]